MSWITARKRIRNDGVEASTSPITNTLENPPSSITYGVSKRDALLESEIISLKAEIEQLQSLRRLDNAKFQSTEQRLKRYIVSLEQDANDARTLTDNIKNEYERLVEESSKKKKDDARRIYTAEQTISTLERQVQQLREKERILVSSSSSTLSTFKQSFHSFSENDEDEDDYDDTVEKSTDYDSFQNVDQLQLCVGMLDKKNTLLQKRIDNYFNQLEALKNQLKVSEEKLTIAESQVALKSLDSSLSTLHETISTETSHTSSPVSPAPRELLLELNNKRMQLADAQCVIRQQDRTIKELKSEAKNVSLAKESARRNEARAENLQGELISLRKEKDTFYHVQKLWADWTINLKLKQERWLPNHTFATTTAQENMNASTSSQTYSTELLFTTPPELVSIQNLILSIEDKYTKLEGEFTQTKQELHATYKKVTSLQDTIQQYVTSMDQIVLEKKQVENKLLQTEKQLRILQAQEGIWRKESDGLRELLATYKLMEDQMISKSKGEIAGSNLLEDRRREGNATISGLQVSLNASREQIQVLEDEMMNLKSELGTINQSYKSLQDEHDRVLNKFHLLKDALGKEREKVAEAESRVLQAESLAGKGSFNENMTRVVHLRSNPLLLAVREKYEQEIRGLKNALEENNKEASTNRGESSVPAGLDPQKYNQRLKDNFRRQIGIFRESVYLITGYKIDMLTDNTERPRFKVRSMYAEREEDHLMFIWPALDEGDLPKSLDLLDSEMAQALMNDPCFKAMTQFHSLPAFTAGLTLSLFEKQTIVTS